MVLSLMRFSRRFSQIVLAASMSLLLLSACVSRVDNRGLFRENLSFDEVKPGVTTKAEVLKRFGTPSSQSAFGEDTWFYITTRKEAIAFLKPEVVEQQVTRIIFDDTGVVKTVRDYDKSQGQDVDVVDDFTPTEGHRLTFIEQLLGNLGRFNKPQE